MKRPVVAIASLAFAIVAAALSAAALSTAFAIWSCIGRAPLSTQTLAIRALICMAFAFPAALLLGAFASNPP
jgi:multidrug transporter EmrE-like cation transporter